MRRAQLDIQLKTAEQIELMRGAGLVVAAALQAMREAVAPGVTTADLDAIAEKVIRDAGAVPSKYRDASAQAVLPQMEPVWRPPKSSAGIWIPPYSRESPA